MFRTSKLIPAAALTAHCGSFDGRCPRQCGDARQACPPGRREDREGPSGRDAPDRHAQAGKEGRQPHRRQDEARRAHRVAEKGTRLILAAAAGRYSRVPPLPPVSRQASDAPPALDHYPRDPGFPPCRCATAAASERSSPAPRSLLAGSRRPNRFSASARRSSFIPMPWSRHFDDEAVGVLTAFRPISPAPYFSALSIRLAIAWPSSSRWTNACDSRRGGRSDRMAAIFGERTVYLGHIVQQC